MQPEKKKIVQVHEFQVGGKTFGLSYTTNAMILLEEKFGVDSIFELLNTWGVKVPGMKDIRLLAWGGLEGWRRAHKKNDADYPPFELEDVGEILDAFADQCGKGALEALSDMLVASSGLDVQKKLEGETKAEGDAPLEVPAETPILPTSEVGPVS